MKTGVFKLIFKEQGGILFPANPELHQKAISYAAENLADKINLTDYRDVWLGGEVNSKNELVRPLGLLGMVLRADFPLVRFTDNVICKKLVDRANDYLHDQGACGQEVFVRIGASETPEQRCPDYLGWIEAFGMRPAERYVYTIR